MPRIKCGGNWEPFHRKPFIRTRVARIVVSVRRPYSLEFDISVYDIDNDSEFDVIVGSWVYCFGGIGSCQLNKALRFEFSWLPLDCSNTLCT
jgi:hypothetical protein